MIDVEPSSTTGELKFVLFYILVFLLNIVTAFMLTSETKSVRIKIYERFDATREEEKVVDIEDNAVRSNLVSKILEFFEIVD